MPIHDPGIPRPAVAAGDSENDHSLKDVKILVLDDEVEIRRYIKSALQSTGCQVETADGGQTGLQILLKQDFEVLVVDIRMAEMNGLAFIEEAKKIWPWLGIVIITGYADEEIYGQARALGVEHILEKPIQLAALKKAILQELGRSREQLELVNRQPHSQVQYQLGLLRQLGEMAVEGESLVQALRNLTKGVGRLLPSSAVGLFDKTDDECYAILNVQEEISPDSVQMIMDEMIQRYEALSGNAVDREHLRTEVEPRNLVNPSATYSTKTITTVPILSEGSVQGLLTLASDQENAYSGSDISFLYHAASHFSTALVALTRMRGLAARDALTGLYNRRQLMEELSYAWGFTERYGHPMSIVIIDIDHYKIINDSYGHLVGDRILAEFSSLLTQLARTSDILGRYGGDEFFAVLPQTNIQEALTFCTRLLHATRKQVFCEGDHDIELRLSIGLANTYSEQPPENLEDFMEQADQALYASKNAGRNRCTVWRPALVASKSDAHVTQPESLPVVPEPVYRANLLVVDDEPSVCRMMERILTKENFKVQTCNSAHQAIELIEVAKEHFDIVFIDLNLSEESGLDFIDQLKIVDPSVIKIVISGEATADNAIASLRFGAYDFIAKPIDRDSLSIIIDRALEYRRLSMENQRYQANLEGLVREKNKALVTTMEQLKTSYEFTLEAMVKMLDAREQSTGQHSVRVQALSLIMARELKLSEEEMHIIARGALLHDIGKISIPDAILLKPGPLSDSEWEVMKSHVEIGYSVIKSNPHLQKEADIVFSHHERFDGDGYPRGLKGKEICLGARIFAIVDAYDAMRSERVYRKSTPEKEVIAEIHRCSGTHFDPDIVEVFLRCQVEFEAAGDWWNPNPDSPVDTSS
jgi:diguanylate cyclase (GGDEF)-like protein/putative nucleotidyltransferase with HDIG domain